MKLTILGSSGGYSGAENPSSGFLLEHAGARLWIDAGHGTFSALQRQTAFTGVDAILISHVHADHCVDLYAFNIAMRFHEQGVLRRSLYCPQEVWDRMPLLLGDPPEGEKGFGQSFDLHPTEAGGTVEVCGVRVSFLRTDHPNYCLAMRLESEAGVLTYSADTGPGADLAGFAQGSDLLLCEATYQEGRVGAPVHLTAAQAGETALRAEARRLVLTHVWPAFDPRRSVEEAQAAAGGLNVEWAAPGATFEVRRS
ncbi:MAG TPA: MBL fold metallo-hydrolase [Thermoanaerobaculia bacterium]|jgi:ribonuclease BN (tRNA processing enzyme)|nr:MBL fold metallo-hydrolase [Thermoanaerobaculia bacterium]